MENSGNSSWVTHKLRIHSRNAVFLLNATFWLLVIYFSIHDDKIAAFLSYVSVTLTILTVKYYSWEVINNESAACFIDCSSKILVLTGMFLALLPDFWNTAFYSICLGILLQRAKREMQVRARNEFLYLLMKASIEDTKTDNDEMKVLELHNETHEMQINKNKIYNLNVDECCKSVGLNEKNDFLLENTTEKHCIEMKHEENIQKEIQCFHKQNNFPDESETMSDHKVLSFRKGRLGDPEESDENSLRDHYYSRLTVPKEAVESTLKRMEYLTESNVLSNNEEPEENKKSTGKLCTLQINLLNLKELELSEQSKLEYKFELNENNIQKELKRNEEACVNTSVKLEDLNIESLKDFSKDYSKQSDIADNTESITESRNTVKNEPYSVQVHFCSDVCTCNSKMFIQNDELVGSYSTKNSALMNESEGKSETVVERVNLKEENLKLLSKDNENLLSLKDKTTILDTTLQYKENIGKINCQKVDTDSELEISSEKNLNPVAEYTSTDCTSLKAINFQPEKETSTYLIKGIPQIFNDEATNLNACLQHKERTGETCSSDFEINRGKNLTNETNLQENSFEIDKTVSSEVNFSNMNYTSVKTTDIQPENGISSQKLASQDNDSKLETVLEKDKIFLESEYHFKSKCLSNLSDDEDKTHFRNVSNVDDVINTIDLGFIYALGFNVPHTEFVL